MRDADGYSDAANSTAVGDEELITVVVDGQHIVLTRRDGQPYAFTRWCPHASGDLSQGAAYNGKVVCSEHNWVFDLTTGAILYPDDEYGKLACYPVREAAGRLWVKLPLKK